MYNIEYIFGSKIDNGTLLHAIKWKNYSKKDMTYEPFENIGIQNISSINRYKRLSDYTIFHQNVNQMKEYGIQIHQRANQQEILIHPQEVQDQETNIDKTEEQLQQNNIKIEPEQQESEPQSKEIYQPRTRKGKLKQNQNKKKKLDDQYQPEIIKQEVIKQEIEEIYSEQYLNQLNQVLNNLTIDNLEIIQNQIQEPNNPFELLYLMLVLDRQNQYEEIEYGLNQQYEEIDYIKPKFKSRKKLIKKRGRVPFLQKNSEINTVTISDLLNSTSQKPEISLVQSQVDQDKIYGQIGFDKGKKIIGHCFGISVDDPTQKKISFNIYFLMEFKEREDSSKPKENYASKLQTELYEKQLLMDYLNDNRKYLPDLAEEILD